ncbi:MAG: hypothetical protein ACRD0W_09640 [Acidimicrobiales bacterium]
MPSPTRDQVYEAISGSPVSPDAAWRATDAVMALLAEAPQPKVLWRGTVLREPSPHLFPDLPPHLVVARVEAEPGTRVVVTEDTESPL